MATLLDTFYVNTRIHSRHPAHGTWATSAVTLTTGVDYSVVVDGNWNRWSGTLKGDPQPIMYPAPGDIATAAVTDADVLFAQRSTTSYTYGHDVSALAMNLGSGWAHIEPVGGPFSTYQPGHEYSYNLTGQGSALLVAIDDDPISDNSGRLRVRIFQRILGPTVGSISPGLMA